MNSLHCPSHGARRRITRVDSKQRSTVERAEAYALHQLYSEQSHLSFSCLDGDICQKRHRVLWLDITGIKTHVALTFTNFSALSLYGTAIRANFSLVHILCMRPVYRTRRGCTQRAHQRAADNHGEQTKPDTFMPGYTQQTHCAPGSSGRALLLLMFHRNDFYCPVHLT
ncbi:hypothetical protein F2P81_009160 [Scophthalmus maximus]|uniref:Uncharacterized protein n=1 Tax=Scophthalmus maximus TaxID=52904 RepID=A0A6A4STX0_SCOMX|nr:hypothetical protein F2P81_009160 [Scophthalmus maximus]